MATHHKIIPEFLCTDASATKDFYVRVLGFRVRYERAEENFVRVTLDGADLMFEEARGPGRRWITGPLERPFGRGINLQIDVGDVQALHARVTRLAPHSIYLPLEEKAYRCGDTMSLNTQFIVQDPDGYLLRFAQSHD